MDGTSSQSKGCIAYGPWGGSQGEEWVYKPKGFIKKIKISVRYGGVVDSINFQTFFENGKPLNSFFGGKGGNRTDTICLDYPNEYLKSISGKLGNYEGHNVVMSICFSTNLNRYGPYGTNSGTSFSNDGEGVVIVGFHGRAKKYLDAIGVYVMPKSLALGPKPTSKDKNLMLETEKLCSSMSRMAIPRDAGPWGAGGGKPWDDGVFSAVKQIRIFLGSLNAVYALQFEYLKSDGNCVLSQIHGGTDGFEIQRIDLNVKDEYLTVVFGFFGPVDGLEAVVSITFHTNKRVYGPYGDEIGAGNTYYGSILSIGKVVGFHGRSHGFLSAIGVHMEYF
ncbi:hypothetical protein R6Q59_025257 [Mikania micrantha]